MATQRSREIKRRQNRRAKRLKERAKAAGQATPKK